MKKFSILVTKSDFITIEANSKEEVRDIIDNLPKGEIDSRVSGRWCYEDIDEIEE